MKFRWKCAATFAAILVLSAKANAQQSNSNSLMCVKFEAQVKHHAKALKSSPITVQQRASLGAKLSKPAEKLAFALVTSFNMTPHNSAYVANGLCSMQKYKLS